ncbi:MAG: ABC transporter ATP-binding protein [Faecousia sp.]
MNMAVITAKQVVYEYRNKYQTVKAVNGVSFTFTAGTLYAIVGVSGSGKTTLLSLLAGLDVPTGGSIEFDGTPTSKIDRDQYRLEHVSVIYQNFNLFYHLTVLENAAYPLYVRKMQRKEADLLAREKLLAVGLKEEQFKRFPNMLSGGEQQRVAIARALAAGSEIILADEPTGNLDTGNRENIVEILSRLAHEENRCVIIVTHDPAVAEAADVTLHMQDGKLTEE